MKKWMTNKIMSNKVKITDLRDDQIRQISGLTPLWQAIFVLNYTNEILSSREIESFLEQVGIGTTASQIQMAFTSGGNNRVKVKKIDGKTKYLLLIHGKKEIEQELGSEGPIEVIYIESGRPRSAKKELSEVFRGLTGTIRILDTYFGEKSFDVLELLDQALNIRFLSKTLSGSKSKVKSVYSDFQIEYANFEFRLIAPSTKVHDRYVITDDSIIFIGHGLKDIGNSQSFIIRLNNNIAPDLLDQVKKEFDKMWDNARPFT